MTKLLEIADLDIVSESIVDASGRVFYYQGRVLRVIYDVSQAKFYTQLLKQPWIEGMFRAGLIETWVADDLAVVGAPLVLEHRRLPFDTHPVESTDHMHWKMAVSFIKLVMELSRRGVFVKDAHPWNIMLGKGDVKFIDFGSLTQDEIDVKAWLNEFYTYFVVPIWLSSSRWRRFSKLYRREHLAGFGIMVFQSAVLKKWIWGRIFSLHRKGRSVGEILSGIYMWLECKQPKEMAGGRWVDYEQNHGVGEAIYPVTTKQKFIFDVLTEMRPEKVLDCAANKGFYSEMAASFGADVVAFDYEEACVDNCFNLAWKKQLTIISVWMDFCQPTPRYGLGLCGRDSFSRFRSDLVLALGLVHHLCLVQRFPVELFCDICMLYSVSGIIIEYVDPEDVHVREWSVEIPPDYSQQNFLNYFQRKKWYLSHKVDMNEDGLKRSMLYLLKYDISTSENFH
ncbi:MAG: hypothetical protein ABW148_08440 [Sedimenticola sp.]